MEANISSPKERTCATSELDWRTSGNEQDHPVRSTHEWLAEASPVRIGLVLSGGGLRGASHVGVLQQLVEHDIPIDVIVGSSAGAVSAAYYAAVGLTLDDLIQDADELPRAARSGA
jgi:predicted acylesterase/phospholipase RssA